MPLFSSPTPPLSLDETMRGWDALATDEGELAIDVFRDKDALVIQSMIAGVKNEDLDISIHEDLLTIRGHREPAQNTSEDDWFYRECYWGPFSRSIVLPLDVSMDRAEATIKNGVLTVRIPIRSERRVTVRQIEVQSLDDSA